MKRKMFILAAGLMVSALMFGCGTENPWEANPVNPLELLMVSVPDTNAVIPTGSNVSFFWSVKGGTGEYAGCQWYLNPPASAWGDTVQSYSATYQNLQVTSGNSTDYTFHVRVIDSDGTVLADSAMFTVSITDQNSPTITIAQSPIAGSFVATGSTIRFAWDAEDGFGNSDALNFQYIYTPTNDTSNWLSATTVAFSDADVPATDPAWFFVRARDQFDNTSAWDSLSFIIKDATILIIDDYQWLDANGNPDMPKEREEKQFYRDALEGYAFAEWDVELQNFPDSSDLVDAGTPVYSTIIYAADSNLGSTSGNAWTYLGDAGNGKGYSIRYYLEQGGNLLLGGALAVYDMTQAYPPAVVEGDFEFDWLGVDSTEWCFDYWADFTWAVKDTTTTLNLPDSMKIDVAKNGDQVDYAIETPGLRDEATVTTEVIYVWGLNIEGGPTDAYGHPLGHITKWDGTTRTALLNFDMYSMPLDGIRQTFQTILTEFGE